MHLTDRRIIKAQAMVDNCWRRVNKRLEKACFVAWRRWVRFKKYRSYIFAILAPTIVNGKPHLRSLTTCFHMWRYWTLRGRILRASRQTLISLQKEIKVVATELTEKNRLNDASRDILEETLRAYASNPDNPDNL